MSSHLGSCSAVDLRTSPQELKVPVKSCRRRLGGQFLEQNDKQLPDDNHQIFVKVGRCGWHGMFRTVTVVSFFLHV